MAQFSIVEFAERQPAAVLFAIAVAVAAIEPVAGGQVVTTREQPPPTPQPVLAWAIPADAGVETPLQPLFGLETMLERNILLNTEVTRSFPLDVEI